PAVDGAPNQFGNPVAEPLRRNGPALCSRLNGLLNVLDGFLGALEEQRLAIRVVSQDVGVPEEPDSVGIIPELSNQAALAQSFGRCRIEVPPARGKVDLHPAVRIRLAHDVRVTYRV